MAEPGAGAVLAASQLVMGDIEVAEAVPLDVAGCLGAEIAELGASAERDGERAAAAAAAASGAPKIGQCRCMDLSRPLACVEANGDGKIEPTGARLQTWLRNDIWEAGRGTRNARPCSGPVLHVNHKESWAIYWVRWHDAGGR